MYLALLSPAMMLQHCFFMPLLEHKLTGMFFLLHFAWDSSAGL